MELDELLAYSIEESSPFFNPASSAHTLTRWSLPYLGSVRRVAQNMNKGWENPYRHIRKG